MGRIALGPKSSGTAAIARVPPQRRQAISRFLASKSTVNQSWAHRTARSAALTAMIRTLASAARTISLSSTVASEGPAQTIRTRSERFSIWPQGMPTITEPPHIRDRPAGIQRGSFPQGFLLGNPARDAVGPTHGHMVAKAPDLPLDR